MSTLGIILAGGTGSRLWPLTNIVCKQLLPVFDKPMIYYPLATLMEGGVRDILIIVTEHDLPSFQNLLGNGNHIGINIRYTVQKEPKGIAQALHIANDFVTDQTENIVLILGDNIFYSKKFYDSCTDLFVKNASGATIFGVKVDDPSRYGVLGFLKGRVVSIEEKPHDPKSQWIVPGLYVYDRTALVLSQTLKPSARGEYEITDLHNIYLSNNTLTVHLEHDVLWADMGTPLSLLKTSETLSQQTTPIAYIEEIALRKGYINNKQFTDLIKTYPACYYSDVLVYGCNTNF